MTDIEKAEAEIQQLLADINSGFDATLLDLITEKIKAYGQLREDVGWDHGFEAGMDHY